MTKWKYHNLGEIKNFLGIYISCNYRDQNISLDQFEYFNKVLV